ncbi:MEKHLA domain-containing protein [Kiloniella laminariae]|uniref:MEKHLA domain-containing protein n=1 Tax=Kiloniella laminariae TaxID=454162 RepID=A0ABT4LNU8_9PROT|nr:MEKHLA domain-containing protein [Kiloniella laminariae]MCZ4282784.1 MEKHLA domain-containing protein [Kiloniella laminariae]
MDRHQKFLEEHALRLTQSFKLATGRDLLAQQQEQLEMIEGHTLGQCLFSAPQIIVSHDGCEDPLLNYGNRAALELWDMTWDEFVGTPSRYTAEPHERGDRSSMLEQARAKGYIDNYQGIRISSTGRRFMIRNAIIWAVPGFNNSKSGQAATFNEWYFCD